MASFDKAVEFTLVNEGVFSNDRNDHGGKTKYGITEGDLKEYQENTGHIPGTRIEDLTQGEAIEIYANVYWRYDTLVDQRVATKLFDIGVNTGTVTAIKIAQTAVNFVLGWEQLMVDGIWGRKTARAINALTSKREDALLFYKALTLFQAQRYVGIVLANHLQLEFIDGWIARAGSRPPA